MTLLGLRQAASAGCARPIRPLRNAFTRTAAWALPTAGLLLASCGSGGSSGGQTGGTPGDLSGAPGDLTSPTVFSYPAGFVGSPGGFIVDPNQGGQASTLQITDIFWGRIVDVYGLDPISSTPTLQFVDYVIGEDVVSNADLTLSVNPVTQREIVTIQHATNSTTFRTVLDALDDGVGPTQPKGLGAFELPPFSFVPRNAALVVQFDDLLDHATVNASSVRVETGYPPETPFEARLRLDPNHGGLVQGESGTEFRSTRLLIDPAISQLEAQQQSPPLGVNAVGLPASVNTSQPNLALRIPSKSDPQTGLFVILTNFTGHALATGGNGPVDFESESVDVVRALRSGGNSDVTGDDFNGFLRDSISPQLVISLGVNVGAPLPLGGDLYEVDLAFASAVCAQSPRVGDVIELAGQIFLEVAADGASPVGGIVSDVLVTNVNPNVTLVAGGPGLYRTAFDTSSDLPECLLNFTPQPSGFPNNGVDPSSELILRFSEPINPETVLPFDSMVVRRGDETDVFRERVVGEIAATGDLREFRFVPVLPFDHQEGNAETFFVDLVGGEDGIRDLAGNPISNVPASIAFNVDPSAPSSTNASIVLSFDSEDDNGDTFPETNGEIVKFTDRGTIEGRPVSRFGAGADRVYPITNLWAANTNVVTEPLNALGARLMTLWRLTDLGIDIEDPANMNIDVEHLNFAPQAGQVGFEIFPLFEISLAHSARKPDEAFDCFGNPLAAASGLFTSAFADNVFIDPNNELTLVHPRGLGYEINPINTKLGVTGTVVHPFPLNMGADESLYRYFTWRDTAVQGVGAPDNWGIPELSGFNAGVLEATGQAGDIQGSGTINTAGLPLLMEFRCFPTGFATLSPNSLDTSIDPSNTTAPFFRVFSSGGLNSSSQTITKNPDLQPSPTGGFNPLGTPPGVATAPADNLSYVGQVDFVIRVSRGFTHWLDTGVGATEYLDPVLEPLPAAQPTGTEVTLAFRGATAVDGVLLNDASVLDLYGDLPVPDSNDLSPELKNEGVTLFPLNDFSWKEDISSINGAQFVQVRMTFVSNPATGVNPSLSAFGIPVNVP